MRSAVAELIELSIISLYYQKAGDLILVLLSGLIVKVTLQVEETKVVLIFKEYFDGIESQNKDNRKKTHPLGAASYLRRVQDASAMSGNRGLGTQPSLKNWLVVGSTTTGSSFTAFQVATSRDRSRKNGQALSYSFASEFWNTRIENLRHFVFFLRGTLTSSSLQRIENISSSLLCLAHVIIG